MQRWEYLVVSLRDGQYTRMLNEYGREGWELVSVAPDLPADVPAPAPAPERRTAGLPVPRVLGRLEDAASAIDRLGGSGSKGAAAEPDAGPTPLLWVLRRPLADE